MIILAIDTSCDETSVAISDDRRILANVISSQIELHKKWGGVVPSIAQRAHREQIDAVLSEALQQAKLSLEQIELFAVTQGPGLAIALEVGVSKAKELAIKYNKPLMAVNHMIGHIYANLAQTKTGQATLNELQYPLLALLVSGNHTEIVLVSSPTDFKVIGATLDDAMGEAYDKVARMLDIGYPGGPILAELADQGDPTAYNFPIPMKGSGDLNFSFSGLKTAVLYTIKKIKERENGRDLTKTEIVNLAASFQRAAFTSIIIKLRKAVAEYGVSTVLMGGGVTANTEFRKTLRQALKPLGVTLHYPDLKKLCTDNAAMIAVAANELYKNGQLPADLTTLDRDPVLEIPRL